MTAASRDRIVTVDSGRRAMILELVAFTFIGAMFIVAGLFIMVDIFSGPALHPLGIGLIVTGFAVDAIGVTRLMLTAKKLQALRN